METASLRTKVPGAFENSAVICNPDKIPIGEVDECQRKLYLRPLTEVTTFYQLVVFFSLCWNYVREEDSKIILQ